MKYTNIILLTDWYFCTQYNNNKFIMKRIFFLKNISKTENIYEKILHDETHF